MVLVIFESILKYIVMDIIIMFIYDFFNFYLNIFGYIL